MPTIKPSIPLPWNTFLGWSAFILGLCILVVLALWGYAIWTFLEMEETSIKVPVLIPSWEFTLISVKRPDLAFFHFLMSGSA